MTKAQHATVDGRLLVAVVEGVMDVSGSFEGRARRLLTDHGLDSHPDAGREYSLSSFVDLLETIDRETGPKTVERIGRAVPNQLSWSSDTVTVESALSSLDESLDGLHDGAAVQCSFRSTGPYAGRVDIETPYPPAFERGLLEGVSKRFGRSPGYVSVSPAAEVRTDGGSRDDTRSVDVAWTADGSARTASI